MDAIEAIKTRRSIRQFQNKPIPRDVIESIIDAGRYAPTARGVQPWEFVVITDKGRLRQLGALAENGPFLADAACAIAVFCSDTKYYLEDGSAATQTIMLAARVYGVGSCWVAGDKKPYAVEVCRVLGAPAAYKLISLIALGYPQTDGDMYVKEKRPLNSLLHWEKF